MMLLVKICAFGGVLFNFLGSLMLLRDFRDIIQLPFFRWRVDSLQGQIEAYVNKSGGFPSSVLRSPVRRALPTTQFSIVELIRADPALRDFMRLNNEHNGFRRSLHLEPFSVIDAFTFNADALQRSFREIRNHLEEWATEPDPESSTDRTKALKLFIGGFFLLTVAAFFDLSLYILGAS